MCEMPSSALQGSKDPWQVVRLAQLALGHAKVGAAVFLRVLARAQTNPPPAAASKRAAHVGPTPFLDRRA
jgi:hypothetical protein